MPTERNPVAAVHTRMSKAPYQVRLVNANPDLRPQYRLGDAVVLRAQSAGQQIARRILQNAEAFRHTILYRYLEQIDLLDPDPRWDTLREVVRAHSTQPRVSKPDPDELVIHLRMGDHKGYQGSVEEFVAFVRHVVERWETPINRVTVVTAIHFGESLIRNRLTAAQLEAHAERVVGRIRRIVEALSTVLPSAAVYSHDDVDTDFCYLANAVNLVPCGGNFSLCAAMISDAEICVPPWANSAGSIDIRESLATTSRPPGPVINGGSGKGSSPENRETAAILCIARNESPYVDEWLEHHFRLGFDRIYFVSTDDDFPAVINRLCRNRYLPQLELFHFRNFRQNWQISCYNTFLPFVVEDWVMVLDLDEFLCFPAHESLQSFLAEIDHSISQVQFPWLLRVSNQYCHDRIADMVAEGTFHASDHVKSMVRRESLDNLGVHSHRFRGGNVLSSGEEITPAPRHVHLLWDTAYTRDNPFVLHVSLRGFLDNLNRILGHRFFNEKNDRHEWERVRDFLTGQGDWESIPNRFLLCKMIERLPPVEQPEFTMPCLDSTTDTGSLRSLFVHHIHELLDVVMPVSEAFDATLEERFQLKWKLSRMDISGAFDLNDYAKSATQVAYLRELRRSLLTSPGRPGIG